MQRAIRSADLLHHSLPRLPPKGVQITMKEKENEQEIGFLSEKAVKMKQITSHPFKAVSLPQLLSILLHHLKDV